MRSYVVSRLLGLIPTLAIISVIIFTVIQLPEGDVVSSTLDRLAAQGIAPTEEYVQNLRAQYNLDKPMWLQYFYWAGNFLTGDMGYSYVFERPVNELVWERLGFTLSITVSALLFTWIVALPIGIYSAVRQYSIGDYVMTTIALVGLATPPFLLALIFMHLGFEWFGVSTGGLFSPEYEDAAWSWGRVVDMLAHLWLPMVIVGLGSAAFTMRILRANLLDELNKPYVVTARAKGVGPVKLVLKYPGAHRHQSLHQQHRADAAGPRFRRSARLPGDGAANHRPAAAAVTPQPGHVPGRKSPDVAGGPYRRRHPAVRPAAGLGRPEDSF